MPSTLAGTGNQPYTAARVDYLATVLQGELPGLDHAVAVAWINQERGVNGNVLGVTYRDESNRQRLYTYSSQEAGIRAAAALVRRSSNYAGIRAALGQSASQQALAIMKSPWNAPTYYGLNAVTSNGPLKKIASGALAQSVNVSAAQTAAAAYAKAIAAKVTSGPVLTWSQFVAKERAGFIARSTAKTGKPPTEQQITAVLLKDYQNYLAKATGSVQQNAQANVTNAVIPAFTANTPDEVTKTLRELGIDPSPTHILTELDVWKITMKALGRDPNTPIDKNNSIYKGYASQLLGQPVSKMIDDWVSGKTYTTSLDPLGAVSNAFEGMQNIIAFFLDAQNWTYIIALVVGVPLALIGFYLLAGVKTGENA